MDPKGDLFYIHLEVEGKRKDEKRYRETRLSIFGSNSSCAVLLVVGLVDWKEAWMEQ